MACLYVEEHEGGCCGIRHIHGMTPFEKKDAEDLEKILAQLDDADGDADIYREDTCYLIEITCTYAQMRDNPLLKDTLVATGFENVSKFRNKNTNNVVYVWHRTTDISGVS